MSDDSMLVTTHWNVASMLLGDRFIHPSPGWLVPLLTFAFGAGSISLVWRLKLTRGLPGLGFGLATYGLVAAGAFVFWRVWLPVAWPVVGGAGVCAVATLICKVASEQQEARRIRGVFSRVVSPDVVSELLEAERLSLGGARREISVLFADVRGFTELTDGVQSRAEAIVRERSLGKEEAEAVQDQHAKELLETVNLYLGTIAEIVKKHRGVLDKYIGDCVMAFWGAPIDNPRHAVDCVKAAMDAQAALAVLNRSRFEENRRRTAENERRKGTVEGALPMLPILQMGSGISTGSVIVGLMGLDASISNYTVFGREVNLANRLESVSGRGRIVINEATFKHLERWDPGLAAECAPLPPVMVKGFRAPVAIYEVKWKGPDAGEAG